MDAAHEGVISQAEKYNRLAMSKITIIRQLQVTLQMTPAALCGKAQNQRAGAEVAQEISTILADVTDLYAS
jgi:hypothetical protein